MKVTHRFTLLGCSSSPGVPRINGDWGNCDPDNPKNRRTRASLLIEQIAADGAKTVVVVDTGPDFREQMIRSKVEHIDAVDNLDPILEVGGIDILFLGPYDLSGSIGLLGQIEHPEVNAAIKKFLKKTEGKVARGIYAKTLEEVERRLKEGFLFIMTAADFSFLEEATAAHWEGIREIRERLGVD